MAERNLFQEPEKAKVRSLLSQLSNREQTILHLRFWEQNSIEDIAKEMRLEWDEVFHTLNKILKILRRECLKQPEFGRFQTTR